MKAIYLSLALTVLTALPPAVRADIVQPLAGKTLPSAPRARSARGIDVEAATQNLRPAHLVRVSVDRDDGTYEQGELMQVSVESEKSGWLYVLIKQADGTTKCLFPNQYDRDNQIPAGRKITLPTSTSRFRLRIAPPLGDELLIALVTQRPLTRGAFGGKSLTDSVVTDIDLDTLIEKGVSVELRNNPTAWAEHCVRIRTVATGQRGVHSVQPRRLALFIGISQYQDRRIPALSICHLDAREMAEFMREHSRLDELGVLLNEQATLKAIKQAFEELRQKTQPGDEIFIYWSGHGATCANTDGTEPDGRSEFLVTYDGNPEDIAGTMVLDKTLGRWIQSLDGRKVCVILDACHSGGHAAGRSIGGARGGLKSADDGGIIRDVNQAAPAAAGSGAAGPGELPWAPLATAADFLGGQLGRIKSLGQDHAAMLFSSAPDEISAERQDGKLSVMTYFLVEKLRASTSLTLFEAYEHVRVEVPKYMKEHFPGRQQNPQLVPPDGGKKVYLR